MTLLGSHLDLVTTSEDDQVDELPPMLSDHSVTLPQTLLPFADSDRTCMIIPDDSRTKWVQVKLGIA